MQAVIFVLKISLLILLARDVSNGKEQKKRKCEADYDEIIKRISTLWVDSIVISGGNPFAETEKLISVLTAIRQYMSAMPVIINLPFSQLNNDVIKICRKYFVTLNVCMTNVYYEGYTENAITVKGEYERKLIQLEKSDVEFIITLLDNKNASDIVLMLENNEIKLKVNGLSSDRKLQDVQKFENRKKIKNKDYFKNMKFNTCLNNTFAITMEGYVRPCPMIDDDLLNLNEEKLDKLFQENLIDKYHRFTKDNVENCQECIYRYSCSDCTAIELEINRGTERHERICDRIRCEQI